MPGVKVIFFDAAGTLIYLPRGVGFHYARVAARHGWEVPEATIRNIFRSVWKGMPSPAVTRQPRADDDKDWWRDLVGRVLDDARAPQGLDRERYFEDVYAEFTQPGVWELFPEVLEVLDSLSFRYRLAVLSNFDGRLRPILQQLGILHRFCDIVLSSEVGADKPHSWIFDSAVARAGIAPCEAVLAGDDLACDVEGAQGAGWQAFHIDRPRTTLRDLAAVFNSAQSGF